MDRDKQYAEWRMRTAHLIDKNTDDADFLIKMLSFHLGQMPTKLKLVGPFYELTVSARRMQEALRKEYPKS